MSEWAYRQCKCGNRIHINTTCEKCNDDPWGVRDAIKQEIANLDKEVETLQDKIAKINAITLNLEKKLERNNH